jgi:aminoglycoside phosphotransferase (APT) family kinase protein
MLSELTARVEADRGYQGGVPGILATAWPALRAVAPEAGAVATALAADPWPLLAAFEGSPTTLSHGDWKYGNLGSHPDGRTILLDWAVPGVAPFCFDVAYYLAINSRRFTEPKESVIAAYRAELERRGVSTHGWFERQLELALLGAFAQLGWEKANEPDELGWWVERVMPTAGTL